MDSNQEKEQQGGNKIVPWLITLGIFGVLYFVVYGRPEDPQTDPPFAARPKERPISRRSVIKDRRKLPTLIVQNDATDAVKVVLLPVTKGIEKQMILVYANTEDALTDIPPGTYSISMAHGTAKGLDKYYGNIFQVAGVRDQKDMITFSNDDSSYTQVTVNVPKISGGNGTFNRREEEVRKK